MRYSLQIALLLVFFTPAAQEIDTTLSQIEKLRQTNCDSALLLSQSLLQSNVNATPTQRARIQLELGLSHYCLGNFDLALQTYQESVNLYEAIPDEPKACEVLNLIGTLQKKQENFGKALDYFNQGLAMAQGSDDLVGQGNSLNNIGLVYLQTDRPEEALSFFLESTDLKSQAGDTVGLSYNYDNLGMVFSQLENYESAETYFKLAGEYKRMIGDQTGYAIVQNNIGEMLLRSGSSDKAKPYFLEALDFATSTNYRDFRQYVLNQLAQVSESQGNIDQAYKYFKKHVALRDSLFNERKSEQVAELELQFQTEKKEKELIEKEAEINRKNTMLTASIGAIVLLVIIGIQGRSRLKWKNRQLLEEEKRRAREAEMNAVISSQEKERNRFARDLHDGFGQLISTLNINLKSIHKEKSKENREKVFDASAQVLEDMYQELKNICFDLMPQTLVKHGLQPALEEFAARINVAGDKYVEVNVFGVEGRLLEIQEISLFRVSQEWTNNILKYSDAEKVSIQLTKDEGEITLLIEDDGIGFNPDVLREGKGNGWRNMTSRSNLIHGELEIDTQEGKRGSALILNSPSQIRYEQTEVLAST